MKTSNKILLSGLILLLIGITVFLIIFRNHLQRDIIIGSGNIVVSERILDPFTGIKVDGNFSVTLQPGETPGLTLSADDNIIDLIISEVKDGVLHLYIRERLGKNSQAQLSIYYSTLETIVSQAGAQIVADAYIVHPRLKIELMAGSRLSLNCRVDELDVNLKAGSEALLKGSARKMAAECLAGSELNAEELMAEIVYLNAHAGSQNKVYASEEIHLVATTGSSVDYYGNPEIKNINTNTGANARSK